MRSWEREDCLVTILRRVYGCRGPIMGKWHFAKLQKNIPRGTPAVSTESAEHITTQRQDHQPADPQALSFLSTSRR